MSESLSPSSIGKAVCLYGIRKTHRGIAELLLLGFAAGSFIALAAQGSSMAAHGIENVSVGRLISGAMFSIGYIMVYVAGGELFASNTIIIITVLEKETSWIKMLKNWLFSYIGNFIGTALVAFLVYKSHQFAYSYGGLGGYTIKLAVDKISLSFSEVFVSGVLCGWIVCTGVWMSYASTNILSKYLAFFITVTLFVTSGFDNSIANMYYIPAGIYASNGESFLKAALDLGMSQNGLESLTWFNMLIKSILPSTLGNIVGGAGLAGTIYWFSHMRSSASTKH